MRLTLQALGLELDITFGLAGSDEDPAAALNGGTLATGLTLDAGSEPFGEARISNHFWDPSEGDEDKRQPRIRGEAGPELVTPLPAGTRITLGFR